MPAMEALGLTIGLASLFSTCIECFEYYKTAQSLGTDIQTLLVKLDVEKTRLLIWGNTVGILQASVMEGRSPDLDNESTAGVVQRCLEQIKSLLTNATELEAKYGVQKVIHSNAIWELPSTGNLVSVNSMNIFKGSYRRFWVRYGSGANRPSVLEKTKWAIRDKSKFDTLIVHLKEFIDGLKELVPVSKELRESQDRLLQGDIASIPDRSRLELVQSACAESYRGLSDMASAVAAGSELGTIDGWLRDTQIDLEDVESIRLGDELRTMSQLDHHLAQIDISETTLRSVLGAYYGSNKIVFVATGTCLGVQSQLPCNSLNLAKRAFDYFKAYCFAAAPSYGRSPWNLNRRISALVQLSTFRLDADEFLTKKSAAIDDADATSCFKAQLPLARVYVYCAPCACAVSTAISLCRDSPLYSNDIVEFVVRPDNRLRASCCPRGDMQPLIWLANAIKHCEASKGTSFGDSLEIWLDQPWLEQRIYQQEEELDLRQGQHPHGPPGNPLNIFAGHKDQVQCAAVVFLAEPSQAQWIMSMPPFQKVARMPRETEIFQMSLASQGGLWQREFLGKYTAKSADAYKKLFQENTQAVTTPTSIGSRRPPSPAFENSAAKRMKDTIFGSVADSEVPDQESDIDDESNI